MNRSAEAIRKNTEISRHNDTVRAHEQVEERPLIMSIALFL
jgi:hypothetical protein